MEQNNNEKGKHHLL